MAKQLSYEDKNTGAVFPNSVWLPVGVYIDVSGPNVKIDFLGYKDKAAAAAVIGTSLGMPNLTKHGSIGSVSYTLSKAEFAALATATPVGASVLDVISTVCYEVAGASAQNTHDDPANPAHPDPNDATKTIPAGQLGFFHAAVDVNLFA